MIGKSARTGSAPHLVIFESELRFITSNAAEWTGLETGGELYGLWSHAARPVVLFVTPPGPHATHEPAHFAQDIEYFRRENELLNDGFGIQFLGDWHSHHLLGLDHPSGGDAAHIASIASRNNLSRMAEMILTCEGEPLEGFQIDAADVANEGPILRSTLGKIVKGRRGRRRSRATPPGRVAAQRVCAHAFFYGVAQKGEYEQCPIRMIPGMSPIRQVLLRSEILQPSAMRACAFSLPLECVSFEAVDGLQKPRGREPEVPTELVEQVLELAEIVKENVETTLRDGLVVVTLPVPNGDRVAVAFDAAPPFVPRAVHLMHTGHSEPIDLTEHTVSDSQAAHLTAIYQRVVQLVAGIEHGSAQRCGKRSSGDDPAQIGARSERGIRDCQLKGFEGCGEWRA